MRPGQSCEERGKEFLNLLYPQFMLLTRILINNHFKVIIEVEGHILPRSVLGVEDAPYLVREFHEKFAEIDLLQLPNYRIYLKLMIDGIPSKPFSALTLGRGSVVADAVAVEPVSLSKIPCKQGILQGILQNRGFWRARDCK